MLPSIEILRNNIRGHVENKEQQGHDTAGCLERLDRVPDSYDALLAFAKSLDALPLRSDWPHVEPIAYDDILKECDPARPTGPVGRIDLADCARRVEAGFLGSVCGCILGKPLEIDPTLAQLEKAFSACSEWPIRDYISEKVGPHLQAVLNRGFHGSWIQCVRERIRYVEPDDDLNYAVLGMLILEKNGIHFTRRQVMQEWLEQLPILTTFGPERMMMIRAAQASYGSWDRDPPFDEWTGVINPGDEKCGAVIRADAYGYACSGRPALAAYLAWKDASFTHRRTGVYGTMFIAALIACVQVMTDRMAAVRTALQFVPRRSRFHKIGADCLRIVETSDDWLTAYRRIHERYGKYGHCRVYQETGTIINTLRFAEDVGDGICKQVMQGCDTDSFGCTAGAILGACFGPGHMEERWLAPFQDDLHMALAKFWDRSLSGVAQRMGRLPALVDRQLREGTSTTGNSPAVLPGVNAGL